MNEEAKKNQVPNLTSPKLFIFVLDIQSHRGKEMADLSEPWWLNGLMCQSIINPMLKVESSNLGASILKFGLFQFSKWLCLDQNNNLGISFRLHC